MLPNFRRNLELVVSAVVLAERVDELRRLVDARVRRVADSIR